MTTTYLRDSHWPGLLRKSLLAALSVLLALAVAGPSVAQMPAPGEPRPHCTVCRRFWDSSPSRIKFTLKFKHTVKEYLVGSLFCYSEFMEDYPDKEPETAVIVNYLTRDDPAPLQLNLKKAVYLYDADGDDEKDAEPHVYAFANKDQAKEAQKDLGGEIVDFDEAMKRIKPLTDEYEPDLELYYSPLKIRGRKK